MPQENNVLETKAQKGYGWRRKLLIGVITVVLTSAALATFFFCGEGGTEKSLFRITSDTTAAFTATEVRSIRETGEWEFLSITTEELVEKQQKGFWGDTFLSCIYQGRLRIGTDLRKAPADAFTAQGDTVLLRLPDVSLLSPDFIDETRTQVFHESGKWTAAAKQELYEMARKQMMARALTEENLTAARNNAEQQLRALFLPLGFREIRIEWIQRK